MPLKSSDGIDSYIKDFKKSKAPQFKGKSDEKKRDMAIAAYLDSRRETKESTFAGNNIKLFGRSNKEPTNELSMRKRWKAKAQRALVGPSKKATPLIFRTMGKDAKDLKKKADAISAVKRADDTKIQIAKRALNKEETIKETLDMSDLDFDNYLKTLTYEELTQLEEGIIGGIAKLGGKAIAGTAKLAGKGLHKALVNKHGNFRLGTAGRADAAQAKLKKIKQKKSDINRLKTAKAAIKREREPTPTATPQMAHTTYEDTSFKVSIDGLPDMYMDAKTPGALLQKLRKIVKQPSLIKDVDRITKNKVKKAWRDKAQGRDVEEEMSHDKDWGTPGSAKHAKKITPGQKGKGKKC